MSAKLRSCFPDETQSLLLEVALAGDAIQSKSAWEKWSARVDIEKLEPASTRLLPLAAHRLNALRVQHREMPRLQGVLRHAWATNLSHRRHVDELLTWLTRESIDHVLLKGLPLAFGVYPNPGTRPMDDVDVLVPFEEAWRTMRLLEDNGWVAVQVPPRRQKGRPENEPLWYQHGTAFRSPEGLNMDLHWFALEECSYVGADRRFWQRRVRLAGSSSIWQLAPEDQLLHLCVHGLRASPVSSIRWIADAILLLRRHGENINWNIVLSEARIRRLVVPLRHALQYLSLHYSELIPAEVLKTFSDESVTYFEKLAHHGNVRARPTTQFVSTWLRYRRMTPDRGFVSRCVGFPRFLRQAWSTESYGAVAYHILRRVCKIPARGAPR